MEAMLTGGDDSMPPSIAVPTPSPPTFSMKSAFSPLVPPGVFNPAAANRYALFQQQQQQHTKRKCVQCNSIEFYVNHTGDHSECIQIKPH